jgi:hypothetical protein
MVSLMRPSSKGLGGCFALPQQPTCAAQHIPSRDQGGPCDPTIFNMSTGHGQITLVGHQTMLQV